MMKVTVITVVYNSLEMLKKTYYSLLNQSYSDFTWIVKDNNSTDGTAEFIESIKGEFKHLQYLNEYDKGIYDAMNQAIESSLISKGLITFLNAGDVYSSNKTIFDLSSQCDINSIITAIPVMVDGKLIHQRLLSNSALHNICHQATFYNTCHPNLADGFKYNDDYLLCADFELLLNLYFKGDIQYLDNVDPVIYDSTGISSVKISKRLIEKTRVVINSKFSIKIKAATLFLIAKGYIRNVFNCNFIK